MLICMSVNNFDALIKYALNASAGYVCSFTCWSDEHTTECWNGATLETKQTWEETLTQKLSVQTVAELWAALICI